MMLIVALSFSPKPRIVQQLELQVAPGSSIKDVLQTLVAHADWQVPAEAGLDGKLKLSIWNRRAKLSDVLRDGDHVSLCRGLLVDPMVARRTRFQKQGARTAGLFSKRRPGAKPGY
jgi:putative ubiquitin-RnfH superfamily antitoxin RatB of RatAB toxin-antitoxin module